MKKLKQRLNKAFNELWKSFIEGFKETYKKT